ncbi:MAG: transposase, partial [Oscillospiraceae bacterium]|nr:transposase [Oscillospiraceae bacterium]
VEDRIVSISQPHIRPIVRGKAKSPVEFGAKYDVSIDEKGHARLEKISFDPYNEGAFLQEMVESYHERTGHYPKRVLVDKIYRTRENIAFCKEHGIRLSGPKLGRKKADGSGTSKEEYKDNIDRIEVERFFSLDKRCNGAGLIVTKLSETTISSIAMSVFVTNLFAVPTTRFFCLFFLDNNSSCVMMSFIEMEP